MMRPRFASQRAIERPCYDAPIANTIEDDYLSGKRSWLRLHERGDKQHEMPAHHTLEGHLDVYNQATGIAADRKVSLFRNAAGIRTGLTRNRLSTAGDWRMSRM
jgi:integrase/recombinase XerD